MSCGRVDQTRRMDSSKSPCNGQCPVLGVPFCCYHKLLITEMEYAVAPVHLVLVAALHRRHTVSNSNLPSFRNVVIVAPHLRAGRHWAAEIWHQQVLMIT